MTIFDKGAIFIRHEVCDIKTEWSNPTQQLVSLSSKLMQLSHPQATYCYRNQLFTSRRRKYSQSEHRKAVVYSTVLLPTVPWCLAWYKIAVQRCLFRYKGSCVTEKTHVIREIFHGISTQKRCLTTSLSKS